MTTAAAHKLARTLMREHGLTGWEFGFDKAIRRFGACYHGRKLITLSQTLVELNDETQVRNTILHEIAHALAGREHGHDNYWRKIAISIGDDGQRCYDSNLVKRPPKKFVGICPNCKMEYPRNRRLDTSCGKCDRRYNPTYKLQWAVANT